MEFAFLLNTTPEFDLAVYTICALTGGSCQFTANGNQVILAATTTTVGGVTVVSGVFSPLWDNKRFRLTSAPPLPAPRPPLQPRSPRITTTPSCRPWWIRWEPPTWTSRLRVTTPSTGGARNPATRMSAPIRKLPFPRVNWQSLSGCSRRWTRPSSSVPFTRSCWMSSITISSLLM